MNLSLVIDFAIVGIAALICGAVLGALFGHWLAARAAARLRDVESRLEAVERALRAGSNTAAVAKAAPSAPARAASDGASQTGKAKAASAS
ncbi:MAG: hypothetical protein ACREP6_06540 [Candidatus Binataceae bacterium]